MLSEDKYLEVRARLLRKGITISGVARMAEVSKVYARRAIRGEFPTPGGDYIRNLVLRIIEDDDFNPYKEGANGAEKD